MFSITQPLHDVLRYCRLSFENNVSNTTGNILSAADMLLQAVVWHSDADENILRSIASTIRDLSNSQPNVNQVLLLYLPSFPNPLPFIEIIPALFSISPPALIKDTITQLNQMLDADNRFLIPIIATIIELPLPIEVIKTVVKLSETALSLVDEEDIPILFRVLLKSLEHINNENLSKRIRCEASKLPIGSVLALVVEVIWEILPTSWRAADWFLSQVNITKMRSAHIS